MKFVFKKIVSALDAFAGTLLSGIIQIFKFLFTLGCSVLIPLILFVVVYGIESIFSIYISEVVYDILWTLIVLLTGILFSYFTCYDVWNEKSEHTDFPMEHTSGLLIVAMLVAILYIWDLGIVWDAEDGLKIFSK